MPGVEKRFKRRVGDKINLESKLLEDSESIQIRFTWHWGREEPASICFGGLEVMLVKGMQVLSSALI